MKKCICFQGKIFVMALLVTAFLLSAVSAGYCAKIDQFSADQVIIDKGGEVTHTSKIYVMPNKIRIDGMVSDNKAALNMIYRKDLKTSWMINSQDKIYYETPLDEEKWAEVLKKDFNQQEQNMGTETVNGYRCQKKRVATTISIMGFKRTTHSFIWVSDRFDMPLRTESEDGDITEMRNIKTGKQPNKLFEAPQGYKKVGSMFELFGSIKPEEENGDDEASQDEVQSEDQDSFFKELPFEVPKGIKDFFGGESKKSE